MKKTAHRAIKLRTSAKRKITHRHVEGLLAAVLLLVVIIAVVSTVPNELPEQYKCVDTDEGNNPFLKGTVTDWRSGSLIQDRCATPNALQEFWCEYSINEPRGKVMFASTQCNCEKGTCTAPDLTVTELSGSATLTGNEPAQIVFTIANKGTATVKGYDFDIYSEPGYAFLITPPAQLLQPGETTEAAYRIEYRFPGRFSIRSILDSHSLLRETDEANNERVDFVTVRSAESE